MEAERCGRSPRPARQADRPPEIEAHERCRRPALYADQLFYVRHSRSQANPRSGSGIDPAAGETGGALVGTLDKRLEAVQGLVPLAGNQVQRSAGLLQALCLDPPKALPAPARAPDQTRPLENAQVLT